MIDYKSPIEVVVDEMHSQMVCDYENGIMKAIQRYNINVDKEELIKALQYDRQQYEKGYQDGLNADKWIPVEERLPEEATTYLVTEEITICSKKQYIVEDRLFGTEKEWLCPSNRKVRAWQPLPQPYKKEGAE